MPFEQASRRAKMDSVDDGYREQVVHQGGCRRIVRRLDLALNFSVFQYEVLSNLDEACKMARTDVEGAIAELDNVFADT